MELKYFFRILTTPSCWTQLGTYSKVYDNWLNKKLDTEDFTSIGEYRATIGGKSLWIANYPYASFTYGELRPSRRTIFKANDKLQGNIFNEDFSN